MVDRRRFLSSTALGAAMLSVRREVALAAREPKAATRTITAQGRYLNMPVKTGVAKRHLKMVVDGKVLREFDIRLTEGNADWWAFTDLTPFKGKVVTLEV